MPATSSKRPSRKRGSDEWSVVSGEGCEMKVIRQFFVVVGLLGLPAGLWGQQEGRFAQWEKAIAAYEEQDKKNPPPKDAFLFVGSSSIRIWDLPKSFPDLPVINRGFGGSHIIDSAHFAARLVNKHQPKMVLLYAGDNNI